MLPAIMNNPDTGSTDVTKATGYHGRDWYYRSYRCYRRQPAATGDPETGATGAAGATGATCTGAAGDNRQSCDGGYSGYRGYWLQWAILRLGANYSQAKCSKNPKCKHALGERHFRGH